MPITKHAMSAKYPISFALSKTKVKITCSSHFYNISHSANYDMSNLKENDE